MGELMVAIAAGFLGIGINRAATYAKAQRHILETLIADPAPAAAAALQLTLAVSRLPAWKRWSFALLRFAVDVTTWPVPEFVEYLDRRRRPDRPE